MKISIRRRTSLLTMAALVALGSGVASSVHAADAFPSKPITIVVPYPAGGVLDIQTRALAQRLSAELGQPVVVDVRTGGNANIAAAYVARATPDGHTLLATTTFVISNPLVDPATRWSPKDLQPVSSFGQTFSYLVVPATSAAKNVKDLVEMAKRAKPPLQFADGGPGTSLTLSFEMLKKSAGVDLEAVPYKGAPPALLDLANGLLAASILPASVAYPQIAAGKLRALATVGRGRTPQLRDVPTFAESGYPDATVLTWFGLHAPAGTPADVIRRIDAAVKVATTVDEVRERIASTGGEVNYMNTSEFSAFLGNETRRWEELARTQKRP